MAQQILTFLPEFLLLAVLPIMFLVQRFRSSATPKTYFTLSRYFLLASLVFTIVMYQYSGYPEYYENSLYTSLFKVIIYLLAWLWFALSCKWFLVEDRSSLGFYALCLVSLAAMSVMISSLNLGVMAIAWLVISLSNYFLLRLGLEHEENGFVEKSYLISILFFGFVFVAGCVLLWQSCGSLSYGNVQLSLQHQGADNLQAMFGVGLVLAVMLFSLSLAPFHFWYLDVIKTAILPVSGWITLIPIFAYFASLVDLIVNMFWSVYPQFQVALIAFALLSMLIGAVGVNGEDNLRRYFGFSTVFHMGFLLISLISFSANSVFSSFVYLLVYVLSMSGVYTSLLGIKSKGIYQEDLPSISGLSKLKPYIAAALLLFMVSLIGSPPMLGFLGKLSVINNLVLEQNYILVAAVLASLILISNGYLRLVKTLYFEEVSHPFDRTDKGIYIFMFANLVVVVVSLLHPRLLMNDFEKMLITVF